MSKSTCGSCGGSGTCRSGGGTAERKGEAMSRQPRETDHRSQGSAWAAEATSDGKGWNTGRDKATERRTSGRRGK